MFSANNINVVPERITLDIIQSRVSELDIFKKYCNGFEEIGKAFKSGFYDDGKPSCYIYQDSNNKLKYKDFGSSDSLDCYSYIMKKYNCNFSESLKIIASDFYISNSNLDIPIEYAIGYSNNKNVLTPRIKPIISIIPRNWNVIDYNYWVKKYGIEFEILDNYKVIPLQYCYLHKGGNTIVFEYNKHNPMYAYKFIHEGKASYKIYWPKSLNKQFKWLFSGEVADNIEGFDNLPQSGDTLIITKSLKDVICCKMCNYDAISLQGEGNKLESSLVDRLLKRFAKIIIFYDNDERGISSSSNICAKYGFQNIMVPLEYNCKDLSELIENIGIEKSSIVLNKLIHNE